MTQPRSAARSGAGDDGAATDAVAAALEAAVSRWRAAGDVRALRRALAALLAELE